MPQSEAPDLHLELETVWAASELLGAPTIGGGCPVRGWWWRGSQKSNKPSKLPEIYKNNKNGRFRARFGLVIAENAVFHSKVLNKIYSQDIFEEYINFKTVHNLSHCGFIPVQSFGSHIRPLSHGLGLNVELSNVQSLGSAKFPPRSLNQQLGPLRKP